MFQYTAIFQEKKLLEYSVPQNNVYVRSCSDLVL